ncbi:transporter substrate-binding domain-containing protein, partial [Salmonella enterica subsp. enterica serovar Kentucky]|nr:transporter substrate-binding domain-containing protein [Salmonella enterica subsp. enterica serovar Kentucky]
HPEVKTVAYDSYQNAIIDLKNGRIDGVFGDTAVVNEWLKTNPVALLLIDNTLDAIKAAASEGKGYTLLPSYEISVKAIDLAEEF